MKQKETSIDVLTVEHGTIEVCILGTTPLILNRMSQKTMHELLLPKGKKTAADKASTLKHNPVEEFQSSPYTDKDENAPTLIQHLATAFKGAIRSAALDMPGTNKSQIGRLTWVNGERIAVYGVPKLFMSVTRCADINKTPDVRTRAILPRWACRISVSYVKPILREQAVANLIASAGITNGMGDWRPGKGAGTYGQFKLVDENDPLYVYLLKNEGRAAQKAALENPEPYDDESAEMLEWFNVESRRRGFKIA